MMQQIRDSLKGPVIYGLLILVIGIPFAFSGIQGYLQNTQDPEVAKVGDVKITQGQLKNAYDQRFRQLQQLYGESFRADMINPATMREAVLKDMVQESLMRQYARSTGYRVADSSLRDSLQKIRDFQEDGRFSAQRYKDVLANVGLTPDRFEAQRRDALVVEQLRQAVVDTAFITPGEAERSAKLIRQQRTFSYLKFDPAKYLPAATVSDAEVAKRYDDKKDSYQAPERIKLAYVELSPSDIAKADPPAPDVLKTLFESEKGSKFSTPEERTPSHIEIAFGADKDAAKKKADELYAQLKGGANFAALAKTNSTDNGSKNSGGVLPAVKRGDGLLPPEFESALFGLGKVGDISEPVAVDQKAWHIIKLDDLKPGREQTFEEPEVQKALIGEYQQAEAQKHFQDDNGRLETLAFENTGSLDPVAKTLNLKVQSTDWFTRTGGAGILANPTVIAAAFSQEILTSGENSKPITLDNGKVVVIRKSEYEAPRQKTLTEVDSSIRDELKNEQAAAKAKVDADAALAALRSGQAIDAVAKANNQVAVSPGPTARDRADLDQPLLAALFTMAHPIGDKPTFGETPLGKGGIAVIALTAVRDDVEAPKAADDTKKQQTALNDARAGSEFAAYRAALEKHVSVDVKTLPKDDTLAQ